QYEEEWREHRARHKKAGGFRRRAITVASVAASLLVLFIVGDGVLHREWLTGDSSRDDQQYIVEGHELDPGLVSISDADGIADEKSITTDDLRAVEDFMGFFPAQPTWLPAGWTLMEYRCVKNEDFLRSTTVFQHPTNEYRIIYEVKVYSDTATARDEIEQNSSGASYSINGHSVYLVDNYDMVTAVWLEGATSYMLFAPTKDDVLKIIQSIE
ncbi:DUF4367 domain-containing protein, partial [Eubacteriales bacterium OttesenSCG-928-A19]|nr:DUF4367 domain-containing protein [Eubacteriales bacterium OttesenSCG-928-A19]